MTHPIASRFLTDDRISPSMTTPLGPRLAHPASEEFSRIARILHLLLGLALLVGCSARKAATDGAPELEVQLTIEPSPALMGEAELIIVLSSPGGEPLSGAQIEVKGDMAHTGMTPVFGEAREAQPGVYLVPFEWTMAGEWHLTVSGELADGRKLLRTFQASVAMPTDSP